MAEGIFSIFPDSQMMPGSSVKDGLLSSQKKALRDVKNTLQTHLKFGKEALKHNLKGSNIAPANHQGREASTEACSLNIFIDDSPEQFWDPCHCEADDGYPFLRMPNEYLSNEDISYLMRGLTGIPSSNYGYDSDSCSVNNNDLDEPFAFDRQDLLDMLPTLPTEIYPLPFDLDPPQLIDSEEEYDGDN